MKLISHRGNLYGPNPSMENKPEYINSALKSGYDVEVDAWLLSDGIYLGHNEPLYKINRYFLQNQRIWTHCKDINSYLELSKYSNINCFFQSNEKIVKTTGGYLWAHSDCKNFNNKTIIVNLDHLEDNSFDAFGICSDYVGEQNSNFTLPFDLLIIDIDGVMTDGTKMYDRDGYVFGKTYCDLDFTAIKRFLAAGIKVCFFSGDRIINESMAKTRKIPFFHNLPGTDKSDMLSIIRNEYSAKCVAYVGDDYYDISIMNLVEFPFCPRTSFGPVQSAATVINVDAGKGVIAGLYDKFENEIAYAFPIDSSDVNPK